MTQREKTPREKTQCETFLDRIDDYVDGALPAAMREECDAHAAECELCRGELAAQQRLLEMAKALPKSIAPKRDMWADVLREIGAPTASLADARRRRIQTMGRFAQVAAAVLAVVAGVLLMDVGRKTADPSQDPLQGTVETVTSVAAAEQEYLHAKEDLLAELYAAEDALPPETLATVEENLRIIEDAVLDIRVALNDNPDNPRLERILIATYKSQVDLLQRAVMLASGS